MKSPRSRTSVPRFTAKPGTVPGRARGGAGNSHLRLDGPAYVWGAGEGCSSVSPGTPGRHQPAAPHLNVKNDEHTPRARAHAIWCLPTSLARNNGSKNGVTEPDSGIWVVLGRTLS